MSSNKVTFSSKVKEELCLNEYVSNDRVRALLAAYIKINGTLVLKGQKTGLILKTENAKIAKFIYEKLNEIYNANAHFSYTTSQYNKNKNTYLINVDEASETIISDLEISFLEGKISRNIVKNDDTISGYLIGAFLACGSINSPETSNYHLELAVNQENFAKWLSKLFAKYKNSDIEPKISKRREKYIVYFKKSDQISNFLIMLGAVSSCMEFENIRVDRDFTNSANRLTNSDTANMKKTYETALRQISEIQLIDARLGIKNISNQKAKELCYLRLENETSNLNDLALLLGEKLNTIITKSNVNHLFRYLHELYLRLNHEHID